MKNKILFMILLLIIPSFCLAEYLVFLKDGSWIVAKTKPVLAFGKVRFKTMEGKFTILDFADVDIDRTKTAIRNPDGVSIELLREERDNDARERIEREERVREYLEGAIESAPGEEAGGAEVGPPVVPTVYVMEGPMRRRVIDYFEGKGVIYAERNVSLLSGEARKQAIEEVRRLAGGMVFPVIKIGETTIIGFDRVRLDHLLGTAGKAMTKPEEEGRVP